MKIHLQKVQTWKLTFDFQLSKILIDDVSHWCGLIWFDFSHWCNLPLGAVRDYVPNGFGKKSEKSGNQSKSISIPWDAQSPELVATILVPPNPSTPALSGTAHCRRLPVERSNGTRPGLRILYGISSWHIVISVPSLNTKWLRKCWWQLILYLRFVVPIMNRVACLLCWCHRPMILM